MRTNLLTTHVKRLKEVLAGFGRRHSLRDPMAAACDELDLTPPQIHSLLWLRLDGPLGMGALAQRLGITEKTVTGIVDRLVRRGLLLRKRGDHDRRVVHCLLTRPGERLATRLDAITSDAMSAFLALMRPAERKSFIRVLENVHQRVLKEASP